MEADFDVNNDDFSVYNDGDMTETFFSDRIHKIMAENMKYNVYVKLLGKSLGYCALHA